MAKSILILQGHPHSGGKHFCHALADAYAAGAKAGGHQVKRLDLAALDFPMLRDPADFLTAAPDAIRKAQDMVTWSNHMVVIYPLWLGTMPAVVKAFFEQLARNNFAIGASENGGWPRQMLKGRSARVIVTMGMPSMAYKLFFGAHGVRGFESGILGMSGIKPVRETLIGGAAGLSEKQAAQWFARIKALGEKGE